MGRWMGWLREEERGVGRGGRGKMGFDMLRSVD